MRALILVVVGLAISGCASTEITGYSDPAYESAVYNSTMVHAPDVGLAQAADLEQGVCERFKERGVTCRTFQSLFPPTREHSPETIFRTLKDQGIQAAIVLLQGGSQSAERTFAYQSFGSASAYGNRVQGQSTSVPMTAFSRAATVRVLLIDGETGETAWLADARTEGQGMVNTTTSAFNSSLSDEVVESLMRSAHFEEGRKR